MRILLKVKFWSTLLNTCDQQITWLLNEEECFLHDLKHLDLRPMLIRSRERFLCLSTLPNEEGRNSSCLNRWNQMENFWEESKSCWLCLLALQYELCCARTDLSWIHQLLYQSKTWWFRCYLNKQQNGLLLNLQNFNC